MTTMDEAVRRVLLRLLGILLRDGDAATRAQAAALVLELSRARG